MTPEEKKIEATAKQLAGFSPLQEVDEEERYYQSHKCTTYDACLKMSKSDAAKEYWQKGMYSEEEVDALSSEIVDLKQYIYSKEIDSRNERERDVEFLKEIKDNLTKYFNRQDVTSGDYAMQMIEDWIRELSKKKVK